MGNEQLRLPAARSRELWLDGLKGFAILLVILGHVLSGYLDAGMFGSAYTSMYNVRTWIYRFHMPLFFLISGYTFTLAYWSGEHLRRSRFFRQLFSIAWLYILFALIQWCVKAAVPDLVNDSYTAEDLKNMFVVPLGNFWYLYVLLIFYLAAAVLRMPRQNPAWLLLAGGISIVVLDAHFNWYYLTQYRILYHFFFFASGCELCRHREVLRSEKLFGCSVMFLTAVCMYWLYQRLRYWYANWSFLIAVSCCVVFLWLFFRYQRLSGFRLFQLCGKYCMELYLLHTFFTAGFRSLLTWAGVTVPWLHVFLNFVISTAACLLIAILAEKTHLDRILFRPGKFLDRIAGAVRSARSSAQHDPAGPSVRDS